MKLYWYWSFNPQKARLALLELGLEHELATVNLARGEQRAPELLARNPNGKIPVLVDGDTVLWESNAILGYLGERERRLWPESAAGKADALRWLFFEARHLSDPIGTLWFAEFVAPRLKIPVDAAGTAPAREALAPLLRVLDDPLGARPWLLGEAFSLVDCCYGPVLDALSLSTFDLGPFPGVRRYLEAARARPAWTKCEFVTADPG